MNQAYVFKSWGLFEKSLLPATFYLHIFSILAEKHGYNIPEVTAAPNEANWLSEDGVKLLNNCRDDNKFPDFAKCLIYDSSFTCFYKSQI